MPSAKVTARHFVSQEAFLAEYAAMPVPAGVPLLVFRLRDLPQLSWTNGRAYARSIERRVSAVVARMTKGILREADRVVHDAGSEWYAIVLLAVSRSGRSATAIDARATLTRMQVALERDTGLAIEVGWTCVSKPISAATFELLREDALQKGARERERYAFFSLVGHELRTPLTSIRGYLETVLESELDHATSRRFLEISYRETLRVGRIVESLFDISLLDLRNGIDEPAACSLHAALDAAMIATSARREERNATLAVDEVADVSIGIREDALAQILINLIDNALKHGRESGKVRVGFDLRDERSVRITVDDDGPGIDAADRAQLFELGERGSTEAEGSGIGLGIVRLFVERAGGEIAIGDSDLGGASCVLILPRNEGESAVSCRKPQSSDIV